MPITDLLMRLVRGVALRTACASALLMVVLALVTVAAPASAGDSLIVNGNLSEGNGSSPTGWRVDAWHPGASTLTWQPAPGGGQLQVVNKQPNDARWVQHLHLAPGWYHFSAQLRTRNVGADKPGGSLCLLQDWVSSQQLHGDNDWQSVDFYVKAGSGGADVDLACRLGGFAGLNTGEVDCRGIRAAAVGAPAASSTPQYDLEAASMASGPPSSGGGEKTATLIIVSGLLLLVGIVWRSRQLRAQKMMFVAERSASGAGESKTKLQPEGASSRLEAPRRKVELILFLLCALTFAYFYQASDHNAATRIDLIRALTERGSVWIDYYAGFNTADIIPMGGHIYSCKAPGGALTGLIQWLMVGGVLRLFLSQGPWFWALATYLTTFLTQGLITALLCVVTYRFTLLMGASQGRAAALALTLALGTILFPSATEFTGEPIAAFSVFTGFYLLVSSRAEDGLGPALMAGLLAGWAVACDYMTFVVAAPVGLYAIWKLWDWRKIGVFSAGAGVSAILTGVYDYIAFGNPFFLSYEAYMLPGSDLFKGQSVGFVGITYPHLSILWDVLLGAQRGLFFCNPVLLLTIPGFYFLWRQPGRRAEFLVIATAIIALILGNGSYGDSIVYWGGGTTTGPRHIIPALPFMMLAMVALPESFDYPLACLALISLWFMLMATAVEPHLPYEYDNPIRDFLWPAYLRGDLAYNKSTFFAGPPIVGDSVAFNLGKLIGLPGAIQLLPLLGMWLGMGWWMLRELEPQWIVWRRWPVVAVTAVLVAIFMPPIAGALAYQPKPQGYYGLMGRYYEGVKPANHAPHFVRIDSNINFDSIVALGSLPPPSSVSWTGRLYAPKAGSYRFVIAADDDGWLTIDGAPVIKDPGNVSMANDDGEIDLKAGWHNIEVGQRNLWGGAAMHLFWQPPGEVQGLIPDRYLTVPETVQNQHGIDG
ncbi:MAG TPA: PA14 domain-containing protein [Candidatus Binataceae bacterium]|nr:PA14 domain-containing protein [Candidatus Binataceae bacterium]